jgi:hypothetical protein
MLTKMTGAVRQISSGLTGFYKKTLPIFWFGIMATFVVSILSAGREQAKLSLLAIPLGGAILGYVMMRTL